MLDMPVGGDQVVIVEVEVPIGQAQGPGESE